MVPIFYKRFLNPDKFVSEIFFYDSIRCIFPCLFFNLARIAILLHEMIAKEKLKK